MCKKFDWLPKGSTFTQLFPNSISSSIQELVRKNKKGLTLNSSGTRDSTHLISNRTVEVHIKPDNQNNENALYRTQHNLFDLLIGLDS